MKNLFSFILISIIMLTSCKEQESKNELSVSEKQKIEVDLRKRVQKIVENSEIGNLEEVAEVYWDSPEFVGVTNGEIKNYEKYIEGDKEYFEILNKQKFSENDLLFTFLSKDIVIATYNGNALADLNDGTKLRLDPFTATLVFKNIDGTWKSVYTNEFMTIEPIATDSTDINK